MHFNEESDDEDEDTTETEEKLQQLHCENDICVQDRSLKDKEVYSEDVNNAWKVIQSWIETSMEWTIKVGQNPIDGCVRSQWSDIYGCVTVLQARLDMGPAELFEDLAFNIDEQLKWNTLVSKFQILEKLSDEIDILYYVVPGAIPKLIKDRDFIIVRRCTKQGEMYFQASCGAKHNGKPEQKKIIRGNNGPGGWILKPVESNPQKSDFLWFSSMQMKGNLPQKLIDQLSPKVMLSYLQPLRKHINDLSKRKS
ncbi:stAR-related lipid transfer protein 3-like isoform X2 [Octopus sinensis]|uniref:StAR-related lipid transfer protein 3-like isoform X2 n=1 Tax=Octopus sinensis TaxID=2607531 RepID=A0A7E6ENC2_9MOLL|nr:stAR-related lipid transfer protein 3-like isoform X2 [Octopus sinensis]